MHDLTVSIVNWNAGSFILDCLKSIFETVKRYSFEVVVVDNNSTDGSIELVEDSYPNIRVIKNKSNVGYARAHNQVLSIVNSRYVLLLNPDCQLLESTVDDMIEFMDTHKAIGLAGCKVILPNGDISNTAVKFPTLQSDCYKHMALFFYPFNKFLKKNVKANAFIGLKIDKDIYEVKEALTGPFLLARMEMIRDIGMLDERFFLFSEENDWCMRAKRRNWKIAYFQNKSVLHLLGKCREKASPTFSEYHFCRSRLLFFRKHYGRLRTIMLAICYSFFAIYVIGIEAIKDIICFMLGFKRSSNRIIQQAKGRLISVFDAISSFKGLSLTGKNNR